MVPKPKTEEATMGDQIEILLCLLVVLVMLCESSERGNGWNLRSLSMPSRIAQ